MPPRFHRSCPALTVAGVLLVNLGTLGVGRGMPTPPSEKDHHLFIGDNTTVLVDGEYRPIIGAGNRSFIVDVNGKPREVHTDRATGVRVNRGLKLSTVSADITGLKITTASDREAAEQMRSLQNSLAVSSAAQDRQDYLQGHAVYEAFNAAARNLPVMGPLPPNYTELNAEYKYAQVEAANKIFLSDMVQSQAGVDRVRSLGNDRLMSGLEAANQGEGIELLPQITAEGGRLSVSGTPSAHPKPVPSAVSAPSAATPVAVHPTAAPKPTAPDRLIHDLGNGWSDRLDLEFTVSSPQPVDDAYLVLSTVFLAPNHQEPFRRVLAQKIGRIGPKPRRVSIYETDFPAGFHVTDYTISLYGGGQEIATNLAADRLDLSAEQAYDYIVADYLATHKDKSLPPAAVLMVPKSRLAAQLTPRLDTPVFVSVDRDGHVQAVSTQRDGRELPPRDIVDALQNFRFIPALDHGVPIAGRAKLVVADFAR